MDTAIGQILAALDESAAAREMPDSAHLYKYYLANGTWIDVNSIPGRTISQATIK